MKTIGDHLRKKRLDLRLPQKQVAKKLSVKTCTITNWEGNATAPTYQYYGAIMHFLGYSPFPVVRMQRRATDAAS